MTMRTEKNKADEGVFPMIQKRKKKHIYENNINSIFFVFVKHRKYKNLKYAIVTFNS